MKFNYQVPIRTLYTADTASLMIHKRLAATTTCTKLLRIKNECFTNLPNSLYGVSTNFNYFLAHFRKTKQKRSEFNIE